MRREVQLILTVIIVAFFTFGLAINWGLAWTATPLAILLVWHRELGLTFSAMLNHEDRYDDA